MLLISDLSNSKVNVTRKKTCNSNINKINYNVQIIQLVKIREE